MQAKPSDFRTSYMDLNFVKFYYANPCFLPCDFYGCFFFLLSMSVLKAHKSLCYYLIFTHVPTMNKTLNLNLNLNLVFVNSICLFRTHTLINSDISVKCRSLRNGGFQTNKIFLISYFLIPGNGTLPYKIHSNVGKY
jgi:hypothetical protein